MQHSHTVTGPGPGGAAHAQRPPVGRGTRRALAAALVGLAGAGGATAALLNSADHTTAVPASAKAITAGPRVPLTAGELIDLTIRPPQFGQLTDPQRRGACLLELGFPESAPILGARTIGSADSPAVVLVLAGSDRGELIGLEVQPDCGTGTGALIAKTTVRRS